MFQFSLWKELWNALSKCHCCFTSLPLHSRRISWLELPCCPWKENMYMVKYGTCNKIWYVHLVYGESLCMFKLITGVCLPVHKVAEQENQLHYSKDQESSRGQAGWAATSRASCATAQLSGSSSNVSLYSVEPITHFVHQWCHVISHGLHLSRWLAGLVGNDSVSSSSDVRDKRPGKVKKRSRNEYTVATRSSTPMFQ